jgi:hypothetical protein
MNWREEYKALWLKDKMKHYAAFYQEAANPLDYIKWPNERTANGLTRLIVKFLTLKGHYANRISTQGQARVHKAPKYNLQSGQIVYNESIRWTKGSTKRGTPDISAIIQGKAVWIEVKIGKDQMSEQQLQQQQDIQDAGGIYYIARNMQEFYVWYNRRFL